MTSRSVALPVLCGLLAAPSGAFRLSPVRHTMPAVRTHTQTIGSWRHAPRLGASLLGELSTLPPTDIIKAVDKGGRFTAADVASSAGVDIVEAKEALTTLTAMLGEQASLEVSQDGDIVYCLPRGVSGALSGRSRAIALRQTWISAKPKLFTVLRVMFGVGLLSSVALIYTTLLFLSSASSRSNDDRDGGGGGGGMSMTFFSPNFFFSPFYSPFDIFFYRPYYYYPTQQGYYGEPQQQMGFFESVFSYVFGDGDPNANLDKEVLQAAAKMIRENGGAVTAEQLAPFVAPPSTTWDDGVNVDESFVLPVLTRLQGVPQVAEDGTIVYVFDDLKVTAALNQASDEFAEYEYNMANSADSLGYVEEKPLKFSQASNFNLVLAGTLGVLNLVGALVLGAKLRELPARVVLPGIFGTVQTLFPALLVFALAFNIAPIARYLALRQKNNEIQKRNTARRFAATILQRAPGRLKNKLAQARKLGSGMRNVDQKKISFSTSDEFAERAKKEKIQDSFDDFDSRLSGRGGDKPDRDLLS